MDKQVELHKLVRYVGPGGSFLAKSEKVNYTGRWRVDTLEDKKTLMIECWYNKTEPASIMDLFPLGHKEVKYRTWYSEEQLKIEIKYLKQEGEIQECTCGGCDG